MTLLWANAHIQPKSKWQKGVSIGREEVGEKEVSDVREL
jgi:hypothetical protein